MRILVVEDEIKMAKVIASALKREGHAIDTSYSGAEGLAMAESEPYDLIVLDRMLPEVEGVEIVKKLRESNISTPVILLTALGTIKDKTTGLDSGADDYLVKPFSIDELISRVRALLRRPPIAQPNILTVGDLSLDTTQKTIIRKNKQISLTSKEYSLLEYLMLHAGQTISKETLIKHVWDFDSDILPNNVEAHIKQLRKKVDKPFSKPLIKTVRGFGYKVES